MERLYREVEAHFRSIARALLSKEQQAQSAESMMLVDDAFLKLLEKSNPGWTDRRQFFGAAAREQLLVDYARTRKRRKRGGANQRPVSLDEAGLEHCVVTDHIEEIVLVNDLIEKHQRSHPEAMEVLRLRYFWQWTLKGISETIFQQPESEVRRLWNIAKALFLTEYGDDPRAKRMPPE